ncbi:ribonuclease M5 [Bacillaceae bacterium SIJ1]|uniref:ribonuclease M5 n=1 Tax=Litoribacterium kuwaitense TaxID=1398745 RepID=UPI0013EE1068|nr:ribonuclease M5 [Litoribacterium kuwaitense]NGP45791.1 ribonuclease M5 [Litoribacterium kuwaitense]
MKIKEMIVVEGKSDTQAIQRAVEADTIETNGSALSEEVLTRIERAQEVRGIIVLTDPDYPGQRIRQMISQRVPMAKHAFIDQKDARASAHQSLGVEHATREAIRTALRHVAEPSPLSEQTTEPITWADFVRAGMVGGDRGRKRRARLGQLLHLGYANGKQMYQRLIQFHITAEEFYKAVEQIQLEETRDA